jgi:hypothetical protein
MFCIVLADTDFLKARFRNEITVSVI